MSKRSNATFEPSQPMIYQFRLQGHLDAQWVEWFGEVTIVLAENGDTLLTSPVTDQAALFGLLRKIRDLGVPLISVVRLEASTPGRKYHGNK